MESELLEILDKSFNKGDSLEELFKKKITLVGLTKTQFEKFANIQRRTLDGILNKTSQQTDIVSLIKVGEFLELKLKDLLILHFKDRPVDDIEQLMSTMKMTTIHKNFDLKALSQIGFIGKNISANDFEKKICQFFGFASIHELKKIDAVLYSKAKRPFSDKQKDFWIKSSYFYFQYINNPNDYSRNDLIDLIPKIKPYTQDEKNGLLTVFQALYKIGITVVFQPKLPNTHVKGATFKVNSKPCIVITDYNKNYSTVWFSLIHELYHVLFDLDEIQTYHLSDETIDLFLIEKKANEFTAKYFLSQEKMKRIEGLINNPSSVDMYAKKWKVHPSIIYGQYQWKQHELGKNYWGAFKEYFPDLKLVTKNLAVLDWKTESLEFLSNNSKKILNPEEKTIKINIKL